MKSMTKNECEDSIAFLKQVLSITTVNGISDESELAMYIQQYLKEYEIDSTIQYVDEKRANLIVNIKGKTKDKYIVWNGHLDTVPFGRLEEWNSEPSNPILKDGKIYARGASDMKSGLAAMVYTICLMKKMGKIPLYGIRFIATCDEEKDGTGALKIIEEDMLGVPEAIIIGEPTDCNLGIAQKGCCWIKLALSGKTSHGAYPKEGINSIQYLFEICRELKEFICQFTHPLLGESTAEITFSKGGVAPNMIPDYCEMTMDIRFTKELTQDIILNKLNEIAYKYKKFTNGKLELNANVLNSRISIEVSENNLWVEFMTKVIRDNDHSAKNIGINYFTDGSIFIKNNLNIPVILFGPGSPSIAHKPNEWVEINKYFEAIEVFKDIFCKAPIYI